MWTVVAGAVTPSIDESESTHWGLLRSEGDALQHAMNHGTKLSVSETTYQICRNCNCTSSTRSGICRTLDPECSFNLTTWESFLRDHKLVSELGAWASKWLGVDGNGHAFDGCPFYDPVAGSPGDTTMHTMVTVTHLELQPFMRHMFKTTDLTPQKFNDALTSFEWAQHDKNDIPTTQSASAFDAEHSILWSSAQTICFVRNSIKVLLEFANPNDPKWQCWVLWVEFVTQAYAPRFSWETLKALEDILEQHHSLYLELYGKTIPKWHYLWHCIMYILLHGNLWQHGCWKGESLIRVFKRWSHRLNSRNPMQQMAIMFARKVAIDTFFRVAQSPTVTTGLYSETTLDTEPDLKVLLQLDPYVQQSMARTGVSPIVSWCKRVKHLSDPLVVGSYFLVQNKSGPALELATVQGIVIVCTQVFLLHRTYESGTFADCKGDYVLAESIRGEIGALNLALEPIRPTSIKRILNRIYF